MDYRKTGRTKGRTNERTDERTEEQLLRGTQRRIEKKTMLSMKEGDNAMGCC